MSAAFLCLCHMTHLERDETTWRSSSTSSGCCCCCCWHRVGSLQAVEVSLNHRGASLHGAGWRVLLCFQNVHQEGAESAAVPRALQGQCHRLGNADIQVSQQLLRGAHDALAALSPQHRLLIQGFRLMLAESTRNFDRPLRNLDSLLGMAHCICQQSTNCRLACSPGSSGHCCCCNALCDSCRSSCLGSCSGSRSGCGSSSSTSGNCCDPSSHSCSRCQAHPKPNEAPI
mmetsp:Transcript_44507/g.95580  ORF Transcript_44507/g.95580 Transcript_44507/m.95580 type:complete len:229 (+) Transcript_44507:566-1252(+)